MEKLNFFTVNPEYLQYLKDAEIEERGFTRIPNMEYNQSRNPKFLLGIVLTVNGIDYYVPVSSFRSQQKDNFLIRVDNGAITSSLRFIYMFPIPKEMVSVRVISTEPDRAYRAFLSQELRYCIKHREEIQHYAKRTYKRVLLGKNPGLLTNSFAFVFLEGKCKEWMVAHNLRAPMQSAERPVVGIPGKPAERSQPPPEPISGIQERSSGCKR